MVWAKPLFAEHWVLFCGPLCLSFLFLVLFCLFLQFFLVGFLLFLMLLL